MLNKKSIVGLLLGISIFALGLTDTFANTLGIVTTSKLNVRSGPSTSYGIVGKASKNEKVTIIETKNGWNKIKIKNGKIGWSTSKYINQNSNNTSTSKPENTSSKPGIATIADLNVRSGPSTKYGIIGKLNKNDKVTVYESSNGWYKVKISNGKIGWSSKKYISLNGSNNSGSDTSKPVMGQKVNVVATAYTGYSTTSTGQKPVWGSIAVDPKVIPYGTKVYIPYFDKVFVANNCGGAIKGNKIDIYMNNRNDCYKWGRRNIEIQILGK